MTAPLCMPDTLDTYLKHFCSPNNSGQTKAERRAVTLKENRSRNLIWRTELSSILPLKLGMLQQQLSPSADLFHVVYLGTQEVCDYTGNEIYIL